MRYLYKVVLNVLAFVSFLVLIYTFQESRVNSLAILKNETQAKHFTYQNSSSSVSFYVRNKNKDYNLWFIFTKVSVNSRIVSKLALFSRSVLVLSTVSLHFHVITDASSKHIAVNILDKWRDISKHPYQVTLWDAANLANKQQMRQLIHTMQPHFSSQPGSYYSDSLFFLSLGLHTFAQNQDRAIMMDVDTKVLVDIKLLFDEVNQFKQTQVLGIAPELTPVYRHVLYMYRAKNRDTKFGKPLSQNGNPGVNSGVLLMDLKKMRNSKIYNELQTKQAVDRLTEKYMFDGHLGDQDWYTLVSEQYPELIYLLDCSWNRQLCQWWNHHGYKDIFELFYKCDTPVKVYHGNCNTAIPS